jgi:hypothetical protein
MGDVVAVLTHPLASVAAALSWVPWALAYRFARRDGGGDA